MPPIKEPSRESVPQEFEPLSKEQFREIIKARVSRIGKELTAAFEFLENYSGAVSFFGSARFTIANPHYKHAQTLAHRIATELNCTVLTGGGGGIMEAANRGAFEAGKNSVGLNIRLSKEQHINSYTTDSIEFDYFFVRRLALSFAAEACIFFPGGFGTLDEFFEIVTLIQTRKIRRIPLILVGKDYWQDLLQFMQKNIYERHRAIDERDMRLFTLTDSDDEIVDSIRSLPPRPESKRRPKS